VGTFRLHNDQVVNIARILFPSDEAFKECVQLLDQAQGGVIKRLSLAVDGIVSSIFHGTLSNLSPFSIEKVELAQILSQPKGSDELFKLLASPV
jgi:hypothetical protein